MRVKEDFALVSSTQSLDATGEDFDKATKPAVTATKVARTVILGEQLREDAESVPGDDSPLEVMPLYLRSSGNPDGDVHPN